jgi:hypothetical protein
MKKEEIKKGDVLRITGTQPRGYKEITVEVEVISGFDPDHPQHNIVIRWRDGKSAAYITDSNVWRAIGTSRVRRLLVDITESEFIKRGS